DFVSKPVELPRLRAAIVDDKAVGTASIIECDLETRKDLSPWLADVYVLPSHRGKKIATKLIERVLEETKKIGISKLFLFTREAEGLYKKMNWKLIDTINYHGDQGTLMKYELN
ncbi:MAG: GNAT family N-acetyltransferase, partial [Bacillota bacterium]